MLPTPRRLARFLAGPLLAFSAAASLPAEAEAGRVIVVPPAGGAVVISNGPHTFLPYTQTRRYGVAPRTQQWIDRGEHALSRGRYAQAQRDFDRAVAHEARHPRGRLHRAGCRY